MRKYLAPIIAIAIVILLVVGMAATGLLWRWFGNKVEYAEKKIDETTKYETLKQVEDTCRAMIVSYIADKLTYEQYKDSDNTEKQSWGEQARMRANKTASTYNNYILENSFVWENNVPKDISDILEYLE